MIEKTTTVETLVTKLTRRINNGSYEPGSKLPSERNLQEEFGVGRLALREALNRLNAMGIIETSHGKGTFVLNRLQSQTLKNMLIPHFALNDSKRLKEFVDARAMVESEIAGLAALQRSEADIHRLEMIVNQEVDSTTSAELVAYMDMQFHQELALIVDNHFLVIMHEALISHIRLFLNAYVEKMNNPSKVLNAHRPILLAVRNANPEEARKQVRQHISYSMRDYEEYIDQKRD